jgi:hypothetical protein
LVRHGQEGVANFVGSFLLYGHKETIESQKLLGKVRKAILLHSNWKPSHAKVVFGIVEMLHLTNPSEFITDKSSPLYKKMHQCQWLLNVIQEVCRMLWNVGKMYTMDEMMVRKKRKYCPVQQYMPKKPIK